MANSRKTGEERGLAPAEAHLRWYFGDGASTAIGDVGLRSSLGSQLEAMHAGVVSNPSIDVDSIERRMAGGIGAVERAERIEAALAALTPVYRAVLRLAYGGRELRPGISPVVKRTSEARRAVKQALGREPSEIEIGDIVARVDIRSPWLRRAQAAAVLLTEAAVVAFAEEMHLVADSRRPGRHISPSFWRWSEGGR